MNKQEYLKRFSRAARWRLPEAEAEEVIADYEELLAQRSAGEESSFSRPGIIGLTILCRYLTE